MPGSNNARIQSTEVSRNVTQPQQTGVRERRGEQANRVLFDPALKSVQNSACNRRYWKCLFSQASRCWLNTSGCSCWTQ